MQNIKKLFFIIITLFPLLSLAAETDPCDNLTGKWKGKSKEDGNTYYYKWDVLNKYHETVQMETRVSFDGKEYSGGRKIIAICKNALVRLPNGYVGTIFGDKITFDYPDLSMELTKKSN